MVLTSLPYHPIISLQEIFLIKANFDTVKFELGFEA